MAPVVPSSSNHTKGPRPKVLVVDDEPAMADAFRDLVKDEVACSLLFADSVTAAERVMQTQHVDLMVTDLHLPDGDGLRLLPKLRAAHPSAGAIVITGHATTEVAIDAMRNGATDLVPKPFTARQLIDRLKVALRRQSVLAQQDKKIDKLKLAVRKLNDARKLVSKKVDLLCNDLVTAYGDLAKQLDGVRTQEGFRKYIEQAKDLEQLLCHAMDWLLRQMGYANVAVYLAGEDGEFQLGAYMKYTTPGDAPLVDALKRVVVPRATRESPVAINCAELKPKLSKDEFAYVQNQELLGVNCSYLGESLAVIFFFRDEQAPFKAEDAKVLEAISPIFAVALASVVRDVTTDDDDDGGAEPTDGPAGQSPFADGDGGTDQSRDGGGGGGKAEESDRDRKRREREYKDDWWKRGDPPPF